MKRPLLLAALAAAFVTARPTPAAALTSVAPSYSVTPYYSGSETIVSFDWSASGDLYYMTDANYSFGGLYKVHNGVTTQLVDAGADYTGSSVAVVGNFAYYNTSDWNPLTYESTEKIFGYNLTTGDLSLVSTAPNYGFLAHQGGLFITGGAVGGASHLYYGALGQDGDLLGDTPADLGTAHASSGPLAFDAAGNLYYATGYDSNTDESGNAQMGIYKWSAGEVASALADPLQSPLSATGHLWLDYTSLYGAPDRYGATSMLFDADGDLLLTITGLAEPSVLVKFGVDDAGAFDGVSSTLLESDGRLGDLKAWDGGIYLSEEGSIYQVVPEPSALLLALLGVGGLCFFRFRRRVVGSALPLLLGAATLHAGPYSQMMDDPNNPYDPPIPGFVGPDGDGIVGGNNTVNPLFVGWATRVVSYLPAPGVSSDYSDSTLGLGPVTGSVYDIVSLGDLYNPAKPPKVSGTAVDPAVTGDAYGFIGYDAPGSITLGFDQAITNGAGADFAVFENGLISYYNTTEGSVSGKLFGELAYVEVSTDGSHFARFPSISLTPSAVGTLGTIDPTNVYNLAGKHVNAEGDSWGTGFDLDALIDDPLVSGGLVDLMRINYVRLVDIPGTGAYLDSEGNPIYDAWVTTGSGGFDLEALGVINQIPEPASALYAAAGAGGLLAFRRFKAAKVA